MSDNDLKECAKARTKGRIALLSYYKKQNGASLWRSSQPKEGLWGVNKEDKKMMKAISDTAVLAARNTKFGFNDPNQETSSLHIYDARSYIAAMANRIKGSGYENLDDYPFAWLKFCDIANIHSMRDSYKKFLDACQTVREDNIHFIEKVAKSEWLYHLSQILKGAVMMAESLCGAKAVLVHCSDGWDRTSQLCALTQILVDPYYRTIEGFEVVVEKEFVWVGHQFMHRLGHGIENVFGFEEFCPVLTQFIDCVYQILVQNPDAFEFNSEFLSEIYENAYSLKYGTFIGNCEEERRRLKVRESTISLWAHLNENKEKYLNPLYKISGSPKEILTMGTEIVRMRVWEEHYLKYVKSVILSEQENTNYAQDIIRLNKKMHDLFAKYEDEIKQVKNEESELEAKIQELGIKL